MATSVMTIDEDRSAVEPETVQYYSKHMAGVDLGDRMMNSFSIQHLTWM
jgi:hypothetical protein